jgi:hypothetical protein
MPKASLVLVDSATRQRKIDRYGELCRQQDLMAPVDAEIAALKEIKSSVLSIG